MKLWGIILAAGESRRMGTPKPLLKIGNHTFIETILKNVGSAGAEKTIIVFNASIQSKIKNLELTNSIHVWNRNVEKGQLHSLKLALKQIPDDVNGAIVCLVDHPCVKKSTYKGLTKCAKKNPGRIVVPIYDKKRGHPVIFPRNLFSELMLAPLSQGARAIVVKHSNEVIEWPSKDEGILKDIDTPEVYELISKQAKYR